MVTMVGQVAALLADELAVQAAIGHVAATMVRTKRQAPARTRKLLVRLLMVVCALRTGVNLTRLVTQSKILLGLVRVAYLLVHTGALEVVLRQVQIVRVDHVSSIVHGDPYCAALESGLGHRVVMETCGLRLRGPVPVVGNSNRPEQTSLVLLLRLQLHLEVMLVRLLPGHDDRVG